MNKSQKKCIDSIGHIMSELADMQFQLLMSGRDSELIEEQSLVVMNELSSLSELVRIGSKGSGAPRAINPYDRRKAG